jgi:hypothetical protein
LHSDYGKVSDWKLENEVRADALVDAIDTLASGIDATAETKRQQDVVDAMGFEDVARVAPVVPAPAIIAEREPEPEAQGYDSSGPYDMSTDNEAKPIRDEPIAEYQFGKKLVSSNQDKEREALDDIYMYGGGLVKRRVKY